MSSFLDRSFTVRQLWLWLRRAIYIAIPMYVVVFFLHAWNMKMGGVSLNSSPFKARIPDRCLAYAARSLSTPAERTAIDNILLRGRITRGSITGFVDGPDLTAECLGYAVLGGLHSRAAGDANFVEQRIDATGDPIVTVRVEYNKPYTMKTGSKQ